MLDESTAAKYLWGVVIVTFPSLIPYIEKNVLTDGMKFCHKKLESLWQPTVKIL